MMYRVMLDDSVPLYGLDIENMLLNPSLEIELNSAGSFSFTLSPYNSSMQEHWDTPPSVMSGEIDVYEGDDIIWFGRPLEIQRDWNNQKVVKCEGALAYFNDTVLRPQEFDKQWWLFVDDDHNKGFFNYIIEEHNKQVTENHTKESNREILVGNIIGIDNDNIYRQTDYNTVADALQSMCLDTNGGYFILRKEYVEEDNRRVAKRYIDWVKEPQSGTDQVAQFARNMVDLNQDLNGSDIVTILIPTGEDDMLINNTTVWDDENPCPFNQPGFTFLHESRSDELIWKEGLEKYGRILKQKDWNDEADKANLQQRACEWMIDQLKEPVTIECTAADLHYITDKDYMINVDGEYIPFMPFFLGQKVEVLSQPHGMIGDGPNGGRMLPIYKININLDSGVKRMSIGTPPKRELTDIVKSGASSTRSSSSGTSSGGSSGSGGTVSIPVKDVRVKNVGDTTYKSVVKKKIAKIDLSDLTTDAVKDVKVNGESVVDQDGNANVMIPPAPTIPVTDVQVDNVSVLEGTIAKIDSSDFEHQAYLTFEVVYENDTPYTRTTTERFPINKNGFYICYAISYGAPIHVNVGYGTDASKIKYIKTEQGSGYGLEVVLAYLSHGDAVDFYNEFDYSANKCCKRIVRIEDLTPDTDIYEFDFAYSTGSMPDISYEYPEYTYPISSYDDSDLTLFLAMSTNSFTDDFSSKGKYDHIFENVETYSLLTLGNMKSFSETGVDLDSSVGISFYCALRVRYSNASGGSGAVDDVQLDGISVVDGNGIAQLSSSDYGTKVIANPSDQATDDLTKVKIGSTVYDIPGGGGGSGGKQYTCDLLFENDPMPSPTSGTGIVTRNYTLNHSIDDYDAVYVIGYMFYYTQNGSNKWEAAASQLIFKRDYYLEATYGTDQDRAFSILSNHTSDNRKLDFRFVDSTTIRTISVRSTSGNEPILYKVYGLKFAASIINNPVSLSDYYDTDEHVVGRWTDGKPLYQVTIHTGALSTGTNYFNLSGGLLDRDTVVDINGTAYNSNYNQYISIHNAHSSSQQFYTRAYITVSDNVDRLCVECGTSYPMNESNITIQYTKTTDVPNTGPIVGNLRYLPTIYSEQEHEIGVWTDGKPLYQKTVNISPITSTEAAYLHGIENVDKFIDANGILVMNWGAEPLYSVGFSQNNVYPQWGSVLKDISSTDFYICIGSSRYAQGVVSAHVTFKYTKTTDTPGSGTWQPDGTPSHIYSTTPHKVGKWIDGSDIWEKTINVGAVSGGQDKTVSLSGVDEVISLRGNAHSSTYNRWVEINYPTAIMGDYSVYAHYNDSTDEINVHAGSNFALDKCYVTIQYTLSS